MRKGVRREKLGVYADALAYINCNPPRQNSHKSRTQGGWTRKITRSAPKDDRYDARSGEGSTTSGPARTRHTESVHQGNGRGGYDGEYDQAAPAPPAPQAPAAPVPAAPAPAAPTPAAPAPPTPAPVAPQAPAVPTAVTPDPAPQAAAAAAPTSPVPTPPTSAPATPDHEQNDDAQTQHSSSTISLSSTVVG